MNLKKHIGIERSLGCRYTGAVALHSHLLSLRLQRQLLPKTASPSADPAVVKQNTLDRTKNLDERGLRYSTHLKRKRMSVKSCGDYRVTL